jgi:hypothetical protein
MAETATAEPKFAFQCANCGTKEIAEAAGENPVPRSCRICGHGDGDPENWIVLAESTHKAKVSGPPKGKKKTATATERMGAKDRG